MRFLVVHHSRMMMNGSEASKHIYEAATKNSRAAGGGGGFGSFAFSFVHEWTAYFSKHRQQMTRLRRRAVQHTARTP